MKPFLFKQYIFLACIIILTAHCSSLRKSAFSMILKKTKDKKADQVKFWSPPQPYKRQTHSQLDALWWNQQTNSYLSYFSNCSRNLQSLKDIEQGTLSEIESYRLIKTQIAKNHIYSVIKIYHPGGEQTMSGMYTLVKKQLLLYFKFYS